YGADDELAVRDGEGQAPVDEGAGREEGDEESSRPVGALGGSAQGAESDEDGDPERVRGENRGAEDRPRPESLGGERGAPSREPHEDRLATRQMQGNARGPRAKEARAATARSRLGTWQNRPRRSLPRRPGRSPTVRPGPPSVSSRRGSMPRRPRS